MMLIALDLQLHASAAVFNITVEESPLRHQPSFAPAMASAVERAQIIAAYPAITAQRYLTGQFS